ncbi:glycosyltransferase family 4 protein [Patescibacteria group bacterium]|nr:glycosyltransferase family 4 protein [Patescibacteria group bacterium]MBU4353412.1 glycosyltransferase family 4 protein [Patescibacteria group bacterium]MBU4477228.1 glycosyltransferase family 4 protein [Patescibacteria group bacterium]MCG2699169.1 glycosyltransferase family 4 protein [Candidatus Parcubacteria bacterium]
MPIKTLFFLFNGRLPSEKAASLFAVKSCEAFADEGLRVVLLAPRRLGRFGQDAYHYYNVKQNFEIVFLPTLDLLFLPIFKKLFFSVGFFFFSFSCALYLKFKAGKRDAIYSNESLPLLFASLFFKNTFYEMHDFPESKLSLFGIFLKRMRRVLVHNRWKINRLNEVFKMNADKIIYEPNAVDVDEFDIAANKDEARRSLALPLDKKIAMYTGHLYGWKGVGTLAQAADSLPAEYLVIFVGGTGKDIKDFKEKHGSNSRILIAGHKKHSEIPLWQKAADVLVLPNTAKENISKYYTSPMKLFEYMASKRPVVATDIPSVREILNNTNAIIVPPDDPEAMAKGIIEALGNNDNLERITEKAYQDVKLHTWSQRAKRILNFMERPVI